LVEQIKQSKSVMFANFQGLKVSESEELRGQCRKQKVGYVASKKTLLKKLWLKSFGSGYQEF
jgi:ribosomal protein L10